MLLQVGAVVNAKRAKRGLMPRAVRSCVVGFPNIGKSALINRLLGKRVVDSAPLPGVTKVLRWCRLGGQVDLLDAPGVIPASFNDQLAAQRLAICNDIGQAAYEDTLIAAAFISRIRGLACANRCAAFPSHCPCSRTHSCACMHAWRLRVHCAKCELRRLPLLPPCLSQSDAVRQLLLVACTISSDECSSTAAASPQWQ